MEASGDDWVIFNAVSIWMGPPHAPLEALARLPHAARQERRGRSPPETSTDDENLKPVLGPSIAKSTLSSKKMEMYHYTKYTPAQSTVHVEAQTMRMPRRIVRTSFQLTSLLFLLFFLVYLLDSHYQVLPTSIHNHLPAHHPGLVITDITVKSCSFSSCKLDPTIWHRIEKDLLLKKGWVTKGYVHIQRKKEADLKVGDKVIMDVKVGRLDPGLGEEAKDAEVWEKRPAGIWIKRSAKRHDSDSSSVITAVDVLFGADAVEPRLGWEVRDQALTLDYPKDTPEARLTLRRGAPKKVELPVPRVRKDGKFKIMQVADLHLSTGLGHCREPVPNDGKNCDADPRTLEFVAKMLDEEKPDFVVLSGDQVNGETAPDAQSAAFKFAHLFAQHHVPYAAIYGNHDDEGSLTRQTTTDLLTSLPYSLTQPGPNTIPGVGNYFIRVLSHTGHHAALTMYFLDTHSYSPDDKKYHGYDWIKPEQIKWFRDTAESLRKDDERYSHIHLDMAFIHIPLPEYRDVGKVMVGERREPPTAPGYNSGFRDALVEMGVSAASCGHDHANDYCLLSDKKAQSAAKLRARDDSSPTPDTSTQDSPSAEFKALPIDATTNTPPSSPLTEEKPERKKDESPASAPPPPSKPPPRSDKIWLCYGGGVGFGGYGGYNNYVRRLRFFEMDANEARIRTWKRLEYGDTSSRIDEQVIVDGGVVVGGEGGGD
ncbi:Metallo-dependent phosphatase [Tothia fuscella]|uniref:Metallo-dependent phosphatase n=1 Tax=Tothia fuscella TaxID=1048955 RepID=A0A9P4TT17_9PEZI|nr:Metallo-dependent phosphatase [Tothia fuscella]